MCRLVIDWRNSKNLQITDVLAEPLILRGGQGGGGVTDRALKQLRDRGVEIRVGMYCDGPTAIKAAVAQGMGVGMVFEESLKAEAAAGKFKILRVHGLELEGHSYIVYSKSRPLLPLAQEFLEILREESDGVAFNGRSKRSNRSITALGSSRMGSPDLVMESSNPNGKLVAAATLDGSKIFSVGSKQKSTDALRG